MLLRAKSLFENCGDKIHTLHAHGKPLSIDLRMLIVNKIILDGGDPATGVFAGRFTDIAHPLDVSSAVVSNVWKRFCTEGTRSPKKHVAGHPRHLCEGDYLTRKILMQFISFDECGLKLPQHGTRIYGNAPVGERVVELTRYAESPNITVNLICSMTGVD